jgi:hypothetical protein
LTTYYFCSGDPRRATGVTATSAAVFRQILQSFPAHYRRCGFTFGQFSFLGLLLKSFFTTITYTVLKKVGGGTLLVIGTPTFMSSFMNTTPGSIFKLQKANLNYGGLFMLIE